MLSSTPNTLFKRPPAEESAESTESNKRPKIENPTETKENPSKKTIAFLDIDETTSATFRKEHGQFAFNIQNLSPFTIDLIKRLKCDGVYFCTHRTDINFNVNVLAQMKNLKDYLDLQNQLQNWPAGKDLNEYIKSFPDHIPALLKKYPLLAGLDLNPENCRTYKIIENFTQATGVPCLGIIMPGLGFVSDGKCRFLERYTVDDDKEIEKNYRRFLEEKKPLLEDTRKFSSVFIGLNNYSKNNMLQILLEKIADKFPGEDITALYMDDVKHLCESAAENLQDLCNQLAQKEGGRITFQVICHCIFENTVEQIPVVGKAEFYPPKLVQAEAEAVSALLALR